MTTPSYVLPIPTSLTLMQRQLNHLFALVALQMPGYGATLPAIGTVPDGKLFTAAGTLYQAQAGTWVAV